MIPPRWKRVPRAHDQTRVQKSHLTNRGVSCVKFRCVALASVHACVRVHVRLSVRARALSGRDSMTSGEYAPGPAPLRARALQTHAQHHASCRGCQGDRRESVSQTQLRRIQHTEEIEPDRSSTKQHTHTHTPTHLHTQLPGLGGWKCSISIFLCAW